MAGTDHFDGAEPVQDRLDFAEVALGEHKQEIVAGQPRREIGSAARFLQTPRKFFHGFIHGGLPVAFAELGKFVQVDGGQA